MSVCESLCLSDLPNAMLSLIDPSTVVSVAGLSLSAYRVLAHCDAIWKEGR